MIAFSLSLVLGILIFGECVFRTSGYGIADKNTYNDDLKLRLVEAGKDINRKEFKSALDLIVNGQRINSSKEGDNTTGGILTDP